MINCHYCGTKTKNPKFCSSSCSASYSNKTKPKRKPEGSCKDCKKPINKRVKYCLECREKRFLPHDKTLGEVIYDKHHKSSAFALVRSRARAVAKSKGKSCFSCGYSKHVEVCHKKPIKEYPLSTMISEINHPDNLLLLCPNCHWEFDKGRLKF